MKVLEHKFLMVRANILEPLKNPTEAKQWLIDLVHDIDMKLLQCVHTNPNAGYCDIEGNKGITAVAMIETSHIMCHIWDEAEPYPLLELDVYTCGSLDINKVFAQIEKFKPVKIDYMFVDRENTINILDKNVRNYQI